MERSSAHYKGVDIKMKAHNKELFLTVSLTLLTAVLTSTRSRVTSN